MKILNLYACLGGNRYKWDEVTDIEVTAVELDPYAAELYQERFPNDTVIIDDAHEYLLNHYKNFDFIWSSPPCPTHSRLALSRKNKPNYKNSYPDMKLYQEIIFLKHFYNGLYCVENVIPYYDPLIQGKKRGRHIYWTNFNLPSVLSDRTFPVCAAKSELKGLCEFHDYDFNQYEGKQSKIKMARNLVEYEAGKTILEAALNKYSRETEQVNLFEEKQ